MKSYKVHYVKYCIGDAMPSTCYPTDISKDYWSMVTDVLGCREEDRGPGGLFSCPTLKSVNPSSKSTNIFENASLATHNSQNSQNVSDYCIQIVNDLALINNGNNFEVSRKHGKIPAIFENLALTLESLINKEIFDRGRTSRLLEADTPEGGTTPLDNEPAKVNIWN